MSQACIITALTNGPSPPWPTLTNYVSNKEAKHALIGIAPTLCWTKWIQTNTPKYQAQPTQKQIRCYIHYYHDVTISYLQLDSVL